MIIYTDFPFENTHCYSLLIVAFEKRSILHSYEGRKDKHMLIKFSTRFNINLRLSWTQ